MRYSNSGTQLQVDTFQNWHWWLNSYSDEYTWRHVDTSTFIFIGGELAMISRMQEVNPEDTERVKRIEEKMQRFNLNQVWASFFFFLSFSLSVSLCVTRSSFSLWLSV